MSASAAEILLQHQEEKSCEITRGNTIQTAGTIVKHNNNNKTTSAAGGDLEAASSAAASKLTSENSKQNLQASTEAITASGNTAAATYARNLLLVHKWVLNFFNFYCIWTNLFFRFVFTSFFLLWSKISMLFHKWVWTIFQNLEHSSDFVFTH